MAARIIMPQGGQTTDESRIVRWYKDVGDPVQRGDVLFDIETDKATLQVESHAKGVLLARNYEEGQSAATGAVGVVRRDPMAMLPFCGYHMADYWQHWLDMGEKLGGKAPKIFNVNWFRTDEDGKFLWPGFGDNLRVLEWILKRCFGEAEAVETPIGWEPRPEDIDLEDSGVELDTLRGLLGVDTALWRDEVKGIREFYQKFGDKLPRQLSEELDVLDARLN